MQVEVDGFTFDIEVTHYTPAVSGTYDFNADSDWDYYGCEEELEYVVHSVSANGSELSDEDADEVVDDMSALVYDAVLKAILESKHDS